MMEFTQINEANVTSQTNHHLNQQGVDVMHEVVVTECEKYPSKIILKDATILDTAVHVAMYCINRKIEKYRAKNA